MLSEMHRLQQKVFELQQAKLQTATPAPVPFTPYQQQQAGARPARGGGGGGSVKKAQEKRKSVYVVFQILCCVNVCAGYVNFFLTSDFS